jgi:3-dehydroquinate synthase
MFVMRDTMADMRHIFLIGLSGSGKSTVGRLLAQELQLPFLDTDALVEAESGERIPALFAQHGEAYFRDCESRALATAINTTPNGAVIATGGGIVLRQENRDLMVQHGVRVWLQIDPEGALERLQAQHTAELARGLVPEIRPLLAGTDPLTALHALLTTRTQLYQEAEIVCDTTYKSGEQVAQEIVARMQDSNLFEVTVTPIVRRIHIGDGYDVVVDWGGVERLAQYLTQRSLPRRVFLFTDSNLATLYGQTLQQDLMSAGFEPHLYTVPAGEKSKSQEHLSAIYDWLLEQRAERSEAIVALGGGVVGDLVGYAAATYLRGVPLIQVPTSLLAQVDAAIGGKTGINHPRGKNLIGAFYHPRLVLVDPRLLLTLPERERTEGWAEVVKYGIILDAELFTQLEASAELLRTFEHPPLQLLCQIIARCIDLKAGIIEEDEREQGRRAILNYGHTVAHALENVAGYGEWLHGEAVSLGMVVAARIAFEARMFSENDMQRQNTLLVALGLPVRYSGSVRAEDILAATRLDKKVAGKQIRWIMPQAIGRVTVTTMPDALVTSVITEFFAKKRA